MDIDDVTYFVDGKAFARWDASQGAWFLPAGDVDLEGSPKLAALLAQD